MKTGYGDSLGFSISKTWIQKQRVAVLRSQFNSDITAELQAGARRVLLEAGMGEDQILFMDVPGAYELPLGAALCLKAGYDGVIALGCVIRGETTHYDFVCQSVERGLSSLQLQYLRPVVFGVLTTENFEQALARAGGDHGHKGQEAAWVALRMMNFKAEVEALDGKK